MPAIANTLLQSKGLALLVPIMDLSSNHSLPSKYPRRLSKTLILLEPKYEIIAKQSCCYTRQLCAAFSLHALRVMIILILAYSTRHSLPTLRTSTCIAFELLMSMPPLKCQGPYFCTIFTSNCTSLQTLAQHQHRHSPTFSQAQVNLQCHMIVSNILTQMHLQQWASMVFIVAYLEASCGTCDCPMYSLANQ